MTHDDRRGIERLSAAVDEVARSLPDPRTTARNDRRRVALAFAAVLVLLAALTWFEARRRAPRVERGHAVEVVSFKVRGQELAAQVVDAKDAGTVLVRPLRRATPSAAVLPGVN